MTGVDLYPTRTAAAPVPTPRLDPVVYGGTDGPLTTDQLAAYQANGFHTVDRLLDDTELTAYQAELDRLSRCDALRGDERIVVEPSSQEIRSIFEVHRISDVFAALVADPRVAGAARQILGSDVYVHQSRVNFKPGFGGAGFYWHSDFETWHAEDGMPRMRAVSISIALTENHPFNGPLLIMPGSHKTFVPYAGETPLDHYRVSLRNQEIGTPAPEALEHLATQQGIASMTGPAGSATIFDCNCMHGSNSNITPYPRSNVFVVFNSTDNALHDPYAAPAPRPTFIAARDM